jgi:hypothetical protein
MDFAGNRQVNRLILDFYQMPSEFEQRNNDLNLLNAEHVIQTSTDLYHT